MSLLEYTNFKMEGWPASSYKMGNYDFQHLTLNYFSPKSLPDFLKTDLNFVGSQSFHIKRCQDILWKIHSWNFVGFCIPVTWNSITEITMGKVLPCNKKVMSLTPDRDNILKTWVHVVLNLMKCILQLIGLNKLKGQYT